MAAPSQVWQIYVHFLERVDISCVTGQRTCQSLVLKGKQSARKVKCFSSHPREIEVHAHLRSQNIPSRSLQSRKRPFNKIYIKNGNCQPSGKIHVRLSGSTLLNTHSSLVRESLFFLLSGSSTTRLSLIPEWIQAASLSPNLVCVTNTAFGNLFFEADAECEL